MVIFSPAADRAWHIPRALVIGNWFDQTRDGVGGPRERIDGRLRSSRAVGGDVGRVATLSAATTSGGAARVAGWNGEKTWV